MKTQRLIRNFHQFPRDILNPIYKDLNQWDEKEDDSEHIIKLNIVILALIRFEQFDINISRLLTVNKKAIYYKHSLYYYIKIIILQIQSMILSGIMLMIR